MKKLTTASVKVSRVMTKNLITVSLGSMVDEAVKKMVDLTLNVFPLLIQRESCMACLLLGI